MMKTIIKGEKVWKNSEKLSGWAGILEKFYSGTSFTSSRRDRKFE
jgi:hypothetical protein